MLFAVLTLTETSPPNALAALPAVSHGHVGWGGMIELPCLAGGALYCAKVAAVLAKNSNNRAEARFGMIAAKSLPLRQSLPPSEGLT